MKTLVKIAIVVATLVMFVSVPGCRKGYYRDNYYDYGDYGFVYWNGQPYCHYDYDAYVSRRVWDNYWRPGVVAPDIAYRLYGPGIDHYQTRQAWGGYWRPSSVCPPNYSRPPCGREGGENYWRPSPVCPPNYSRPCR